MWAVVLRKGGMLVGCCHSLSLGAAISGVGLCCSLALVLDGLGGLQRWRHYSGGGGVVIWLWFGGGRGISFRDIMVIAGFGVCICLQGITSVNSKWVIY